MNILFLGAGRRTSLFRCFASACEKEGEEAKLFSYELSRFVPVARLATVIEGMQWDSPDFRGDLLSKITEHKIRIVIPLMDRAATVLSSMINEVCSLGCWPAVSDFQTCQICEDKLLSATWFYDHHVATPTMRLYRGAGPLIAKPRHGFGGRGQELIAIGQVKEYEAKGYIVQPKIDGQEYTVDAYVSKDGRVLGCVTRKRLRVADGEVITSLTERREPLIKEAERILQEGNFRGPVTLQAIENDHRFWFIDINPRFGGGVVLSIYAGADFPRLLIREVLGRPVEPVTWNEHILMTRAHEEVYFDLNV